MQWLEEVFIKYLDDWKKSVKEREGTYTETERKMMLLSSETQLGLRMTGE